MIANNRGRNGCSVLHVVLGILANGPIPRSKASVTPVPIESTPTHPN